MIKYWEAGAHRPKDPYLVLYTRALDIPEAVLFAEAKHPDEVTAAQSQSGRVPSLTSDQFGELLI